MSKQVISNLVAEVLEARQRLSVISCELSGWTDLISYPLAEVLEARQRLSVVSYQAKDWRHLRGGFFY
jgi:hypothetical protein